MSKAIIFLIFIIYSTIVFFMPNTYVLVLLGINIFFMIIQRKYIKYIVFKTFKIFPFIIFTFLINCILDTFFNALWVSIKLIIVCNITLIYSSTIKIIEFAEVIQFLCTPLKIFKINTDEIKVMVCISLSMLPILKKELLEIKDACIAKNINFNIRNSKYILSVFFLNIMKRVNQIEEALIAKGYNY